jgi:hypothetical protein
MEALEIKTQKVQIEADETITELIPAIRIYPGTAKYRSL